MTEPQILDFSNIEFRASSWGHLMTDAKEKKNLLSKTCIDHLVEVYTLVKNNRNKDISNKYVDKGNAVEQKSIELLENFGYFFVKNTERKRNGYIQGECDIHNKGKFIFDDLDSRTIDVKSAWDINTFRARTIEKTESIYHWQGQAYMILWGARVHYIVYTLIDTPLGLIEDEHRRLLFAMGSKHKDSELYLEGCREISRQLTFSDIPDEERVIIKKIELDTTAEQQMKDRALICKEWLNNYAKLEHERIYTHKGLFLGFVPNLAPSAPMPPVLKTNPKSEDVINIVHNEIVNIINEASSVKPDLEFKSTVTHIENTEINLVEPIDEVTKTLNSISKCQTENECINLYRELKIQFDTHPEYKTALVNRRAEITSQNTEQQTIVPPVKVNMPPPSLPTVKTPETIVNKIESNPIPVVTQQSPQEEPKLEDSILFEQIKSLTSGCKKPDEVRDIYYKNQQFVDLHPELKEFMANKGEELES
jgi:hypothetical protein